MWVMAMLAASFPQVGVDRSRYVRVSSVNSTMLAESCAKSRELGVADFCSGYLLASYDQLSSSRRICPTDQASSGQAVAIGKKYLADHPERWNEHPISLLEAAYRSAFPCR